MIKFAPILFLGFAMASSAAITAGEYAGTYQSGDGTIEGKTRTILVQKDGAPWECRFFFTYEGQEYQGKTTSCEIGADTLKAQYDAEMDSGVIHTKMDGKASGEASMEGTYVSSDQSGSTVSEGKWKTSLHP